MDPVNVVKVKNPKAKGLGLVRDKATGKILWADPHNVPEAVFDQLSDSDKEDLLHGRNASSRRQAE